MTKAESAASRTPRVDAAVVIVNEKARVQLCEPWMYECVDADFARTLELEAADLRERLAKAGIDVADAAELQYWRNINADVMTRKDYADGMSHKERIGLLRIRALAHTKGEDHGS